MRTISLAACCLTLMGALAMGQAGTQSGGSTSSAQGNGQNAATPSAQTGNSGSPGSSAASNPPANQSTQGGQANDMRKMKSKPANGQKNSGKSTDKAQTNPNGQYDNQMNPPPH